MAAGAEGFAVRLKALRAAAGLSLRELAERAGLTSDGIVKLESGTRRPAWETVLALCAALGVDCTAFTGDVVDTESRPRGRPAHDGGPVAAPEVKPAPKAKKRKG